MKSVQLWYFSGTGNTEIGADMIAANFRERGFAVGAGRIGNEAGAESTPAAHESEIARADILGIGAPVIGFGTPALVLSFMKRLPQGNGRKAFIFRTAGGVVPGNHNASHEMIAILRKKGYDIFNERLFSIGSNFVIRYSSETMRKLHDATQDKVSRFCGDILAGTRHFYETKKSRQAGDAIVRTLSAIGLRFLALDFRATKSCSGCGLCAKRCPSANIRIKHGKPRFGASCAACMRCMYACPSKAITMRTLGFMQVQGGYDVKGILGHPERFSNEGTKDNPPFMADYIANQER